MPVRNVYKKRDGTSYVLYDTLQYRVTWDSGLLQYPSRVVVAHQADSPAGVDRLALYRIHSGNPVGHADRPSPRVLPDACEFDPTEVLGPNDALEQTIEVDHGTGEQRAGPWRVVPAASEQPAPTGDSSVCVQDEVITDLRARGTATARSVAADVEARKQVGIARYGRALHPFNGRDALLDAYQEALDLAIYLRQALDERGHTQSAPKESACTSTASTP
jgi:hypothetical protein